MDEFCVDLEWMLSVFPVFGNGNFGELHREHSISCSPARALQTLASDLVTRFRHFLRSLTLVQVVTLLYLLIFLFFCFLREFISF